jgi:hypothetical protein
MNIVKIMKVPFYVGTIDRPLYNTWQERENYFNNYIDENLIFNIQNITYGDLVNFSFPLNMTEKGYDNIIDILACNYCIIYVQNNDGTASGSPRYYFMRCSQDVSGQIEIEVSLDAYTTHWLYFKDSESDVLMERYTMPLSLARGMTSQLNIPEGVNEPKYMSGSLTAGVFGADGQSLVDTELDTLFKNTMWLYVYLKPNSYMSNIYTLQTNGIDRQTICMVFPIGNNVKITQNNYATYYSYSTNDLLFMLDAVVGNLNFTSPTSDQYLDIIRASGGVSPTALQSAQVNLRPYVISMKLSAYPPFEISQRMVTLNAYRKVTSGGVSKIVIDVNPATSYLTMQGFMFYNTINNQQVSALVCSRDSDEQVIRFNIPYQPMASKLNGGEFREYRIVTHKGEYYSIDYNQLNGTSGDVYIGIQEVLSADTTDSYIYLKPNGAAANTIYANNYRNYNGIVMNTDTTIPMSIDALSDFYSTNKNMIQQLEYNNRISAQSVAFQNETLQKQFTNSMLGGGGRLLATAGKIFSLDLIGDTKKNQLEVVENTRQQKLSAVKDIVNASYAIDNYKYAPPQMSGSGNILFNYRVFQTLRPRIDLYNVLPTVLYKWQNHFNRFGQKYGVIQKLNQFDLSQISSNGNYIEMKILSTSYQMSTSDYEKLTSELEGGILRL